ncbi:MAG: hypothetical protein M5U16_10780 [Hyphomicrobium sp.]|nr:hypothetical protein [Hyphomicrobium sp.]
MKSKIALALLGALLACGLTTMTAPAFAGDDASSDDSGTGGGSGTTDGGSGTGGGSGQE